MIIFDGYTFAQQREKELKERVAQIEQTKHLVIAAILFVEDKGSQLYTSLKQQAAERVGIGYQVCEFSVNDDIQKVIERVHQLNDDPAISGIIIQKPSKAHWEEVRRTAGQIQSDFQEWWQTLVVEIHPDKDVDGLHPQTLATVERGTWKQEGKVLPATAKAVIEILQEAERQHPEFFKPDRHIVIIGKSDILGKPLYYELKNQGYSVEMIGSRELQERITSGKSLFDADILISATGRHHLVTGDMTRPGAVLIDVGEPRPDIEPKSVITKAGFITPVPGGVGPVTIISLLENCVTLSTAHDTKSQSTS